MRVLAEGLVHAPPAQIASDAQHGGEGPVDAGWRHLDRGGARHRLKQLGEKEAAMPNWVGKMVAPSKNEWP